MGEQPAVVEPPLLLIICWVDLTNPWCYLAKRRLESVTSMFERPAQVRVRYRAIEAEPGCPAPALPPVQLAAVRAQLGEEQLPSALDGLVPSVSFDACRVVALALASGGLAQQAAVLERLFRAYFAEGRSIQDHASLQRLAAEAGLDERRLSAVLAGQQYVDDVLADQQQAVESGVDVLPYIDVGQSRVIRGPASAQQLLDAMRAAWAEMDVTGMPAGPPSRPAGS